MRELSPRKANWMIEICKLNTDHHETGPNGEWDILLGTGEVYISQQKPGEKPVQNIKIPREIFNRLIDWYMRPQKIRGRP